MISAANPCHLTPLAGVRVVSIALNLPGPACARRLADFGATVVKIEPPGALGGDPMQTYAPRCHEELHRGIDVRKLNLKNPGERATFDELLAHAEILITAQREAALARLQLSEEALSMRFPNLCRIAIIGKKHSAAAGHDLTYLTDAGLAVPPHLPPTLFVDLAGAERAVTATFAALRLMQLSGRGSHCVVSLSDAAYALAGPKRHGLTNAGGLLAGEHPGYNFYRARNGWIALAALEPRFIERLLDASATEFTIEALKKYFATNTIADWQQWAITHDIPLATIADVATS